MNRELKFRAWHKEANKMLQGKSLDIFKWMDEGQPIDVMQFTGLLDKNGKEIYEGDIVKHPQAGEPEDLGFTIVWKDYGFVAKCIRLLIGGDELVTSFDDYFTKTEVIGNIYENPELLQP